MLKNCPIEREIDPGLEKQKNKLEASLSSTVEELIMEYINKWAKPRKRSWEADERCLNKDVKPYWGKRKAKDITRRDIILLLDRIKDRGAPIGANRALACVRRMFNFAVERDIIPASPCVSVKAVAKESRCERCLSVEEIKAFWIELNGSRKLKNEQYAIQMSFGSRLALKFQLATAQRKGEVIGAEWSEICLATGWWTIPPLKAKNGNEHRVPLSGLALELLSEIKNLSGDSRWLFPSDKTDGHITGAAIDHAVRRSEFKDVESFAPHSLRRTAATHMTAMGVSRLTVSKLLNHSDRSITAVYDRYSYDVEKKNALKVWGEKLRAIVNVAELQSNIISLRNTG